MSYGAFVKLEEGIEGLVHISEMSWTKRINHPSELVNIGDKIEVVVLGINKDKQEISLGMKQTQANPWDQVAGKYPPGTMVEGTVRNLTNYGAFIEIEEGIDGLLHISDMSWTRKIGHPNEVLEKGQRISCQVLNVDQERKRIALGLKQLKDDPWETDIPNRYEPGDVVKGKVTKLTNFGVFVELEPGLEGLLHISELADHKVDSPEEVVKVGDEIEVKILRVDRGERKIGLSRKKAHWTKPTARKRAKCRRPPSRPRRPRKPRSSRAARRRRPALQHGRQPTLRHGPKTSPPEFHKPRLGHKRNPQSDGRLERKSRGGGFLFPMTRPNDARARPCHSQLPQNSPNESLQSTRQLRPCLGLRVYQIASLRIFPIHPRFPSPS